MTRRLPNLLDTPRGRRVLFTLLYASEGAPIGFLWWALPTLMREAGVAVDRIGWFAGLLVVPWALKFLWAPLVDVARGPRFGLRGWIVCSQIAMALTLIPLLSLDLREGFGVLVPILLAHAIAAATQDAAIDALAISSTGAAERGKLNGWMQAGMLAGRAGLGGGALVMAGRWGERPVVLLLIGIVTGLLLLAFFYRRDETTHGGSFRASARRFGLTLRRAASRRTTWLALVFAVVAGAGFEAAGVLAGPFLVDAGFSAPSVGVFFALPSVLAMMLGAVAGGAAADRFGRRRTVAACLVVLATAIVSLAGLSLLSDARWSYWAALSAVYLGIGLFTASSYALFMDLTEPDIGATQFSAYMGGTNVCEAWAAALGGRVAAQAGYPASFFTMTALSLLALPVLALLPETSAAGRRPHREP